MIAENATPSMYGLVPPDCAEAAAARLTELICGDMENGLVGVIFANLEQLRRAFMDCGFAFNPEKRKSYKNAVSITYFCEVFKSKEFAENAEACPKWLLLVNCMGEQARILNSIQTSGEKPTTEEIKFGEE